MKKKLRISLISFMIVSTMLVSSSIEHALAYDDYQSVYGDESLDAEINSKSTIIRILAKVLISVARNVSLPGTSGKIVEYPGGDIYVEHPSFTFSSTEYKLRKEVVAYGQSTLRMWAQRHALFGGGEVRIELKDSNFRDVTGRTLKSGISFDYKVPVSRGLRKDYYIEYGANTGQKWSLRMFYLQPECDSCLINGNPAILNNKLQDMNFVLNEDNNRIYVKQSDFNSIYRNSERHKKYFSVNDLFTEFYDENTGELTNQTKSLLPGDEVIIKDEIIEINYFEKENYTLIKFNSNNSNHDYHTIMFKGDLTSDYKIGDIINLKFNIIKIDAIGNDIFVDLDYNIQFERTNEVPKIDSFISNK